MSGVEPGREGAVARIVPTRPDAGSAIDLGVARGLADAATKLAGDAGICCVTLTGAGRLFRAGGEVGDRPQTLSDRGVVGRIRPAFHADGGALE